MTSAAITEVMGRGIHNKVGIVTLSDGVKTNFGFYSKLYTSENLLKYKAIDTNITTNAYLNFKEIGADYRVGKYSYAGLVIEKGVGKNIISSGAINLGKTKINTAALGVYYNGVVDEGLNTVLFYGFAVKIGTINQDIKALVIDDKLNTKLEDKYRFHQYALIISGNVGIKYRFDDGYFYIISFDYWLNDFIVDTKTKTDILKSSIVVSTYPQTVYQIGGIAGKLFQIGNGKLQPYVKLYLLIPNPRNTDGSEVIVDDVTFKSRLFMVAQSKVGAGIDYLLSRKYTTKYATTINLDIERTDAITDKEAYSNISIMLSARMKF